MEKVQTKKYDSVSNFVGANFVEANVMIDHIKANINKTMKAIKAGNPVYLTMEDCNAYDRLISIFMSNSDSNVRKRARNLDDIFLDFRIALNAHLKNQNQNSEFGDQ